MFTGAFLFWSTNSKNVCNFCDRRLPSDTQNFEARAVVYANNLEKSCLEATILWNQTMCLSTFFVVCLFWVLISTFQVTRLQTEKWSRDDFLLLSRCSRERRYRRDSNNVSADFSSWDAPENYSCPTRGGIFNIGVEWQIWTRPFRVLLLLRVMDHCDLTPKLSEIWVRGKIQSYGGSSQKSRCLSMFFVSAK